MVYRQAAGGYFVAPENVTRFSMPETDSFPPDFDWGASTSAYQIEGAPLADGAGASIWHRFSHTPGNVRNGDTGDVACEHYERYTDDVRLMAELGLTSYRFSISWSRIFPDGRGRVNRAGLDFYERLVDELLGHDIRPNATLHHWDLPAALDEHGGWVNPDSASWFADYAAAVFDALDDRVSMWATLNEPWVIMDGGYMRGSLAPGHRSVFEAPRVAHNLLRAHAAAVARYRAVGRHQIGIVLNLEPKVPASDTELDRKAALRADAYMNRIFLDPLMRGTYPEDLPELFGEAWPASSSDDLDAVAAPIDFLGINYYKRALVADDPNEWLTRSREVLQRRAVHTDIGWPVYADGLTDVLRWTGERCGDLPLYVTENGAAFYDPPSADQGVDDPLRERYLADHLRAAHRAIETGVNLRGYYVWSLLDNFEWAYGYAKRFGIVHVDFESQKRTVKRSGRFYREVIASNGSVLFK